MIYSMLETQMRLAVELEENLNADGSINWDFVDADVYMETGKFFKDRATYDEYFDEVADMIESERQPGEDAVVQLMMEI
jgi:hypothetical protein